MNIWWKKNAHHKWRETRKREREREIRRYSPNDSQYWNGHRIVAPNADAVFYPLFSSHRHSVAIPCTMNIIKWQSVAIYGRKHGHWYRQLIGWWQRNKPNGYYALFLNAHVRSVWEAKVLYLRCVARSSQSEILTGRKSPNPEMETAQINNPLKIHDQGYGH